MEIASPITCQRWQCLQIDGWIAPAMSRDKILVWCFWRPKLHCLVTSIILSKSTIVVHNKIEGKSCLDASAIRPSCVVLVGSRVSRLGGSSQKKINHQWLHRLHHLSRTSRNHSPCFSFISNYPPSPHIQSIALNYQLKPLINLAQSVYRQFSRQLHSCWSAPTAYYCVPNTPLYLGPRRTSHNTQFSYAKMASSGDVKYPAVNGPGKVSQVYFLPRIDYVRLLTLGMTYSDSFSPFSLAVCFDLRCPNLRR